MLSVERINANVRLSDLITTPTDKLLSYKAALERKCFFNDSDIKRVYLALRFVDFAIRKKGDGV